MDGQHRNPAAGAGPQVSPCACLGCLHVGVCVEVSPCLPEVLHVGVCVKVSPCLPEVLHIGVCVKVSLLP